MFGHRIKIERELFERIEQCARQAGYASPDEFVIHVLEREVHRLLGPGGDDAESEEQVKQRLRGLGYIE
jgi:hypothetical protein